jgi:hypothetical protein
MRKVNASEFTTVLLEGGPGSGRRPGRAGAKADWPSQQKRYGDVWKKVGDRVRSNNKKYALHRFNRLVRMSFDTSSGWKRTIDKYSKP